MSMPLLLLALLFAVFATVEWKRLPLVARVYVGVATAFAIGALMHPGGTIAQVIEEHHDGIAVVLEAARAAGFAAVMVSLATALRRRLGPN
jgi:hypothetical protein